MVLIDRKGFLRLASAGLFTKSGGDRVANALIPFGTSQTETVVSNQPGSVFVESVSTPDLELLSDKEKNEARENFLEQYINWKSKYISETGVNGPDQSRVVVRSEGWANPLEGHTVSEGMGYGMIFALNADDKETFVKMWNYSKSHLGVNGLMDWHVDENGETASDGHGSASHADLDIACALFLAAEKWRDNPDLLMDANTHLNNIETSLILQKEVNGSITNVLMPGDTWSDGNTIINPYHFDFAKFALLKDHSEKPNLWEDVNDSALAIIDNVFKHTGNNNGLLPNWADINGTPGGLGAESDDFGWDAVRLSYVYLRTLLYSGLSDDHQTKIKAGEILNRMNTFFESQQVVFAGYELDGQPTTSSEEPIFTEAGRITSLFSEDKDYRDGWVNFVINLNGFVGDYYQDSIHLMMLLTLAGLFQSGQPNFNVQIPVIIK